MRFKKLRAAIYKWAATGYVELANSQDRGMEAQKSPSDIYPTTIGGRGIATNAVIKSDREALINHNRKLQFSVIPGQGGIAIELYQYDEQKGQSHTSLHVIPEDKELSEEIAHIITLSSLR